MGGYPWSVLSLLVCSQGDVWEREFGEVTVVVNWDFAASVLIGGMVRCCGRGTYLLS